MAWTFTDLMRNRKAAYTAFQMKTASRTLTDIEKMKARAFQKIMEWKVQFVKEDLDSTPLPYRNKLPDEKDFKWLVSCFSPFMPGLAREDMGYIYTEAVKKLDHRYEIHREVRLNGRLFPLLDIPYGSVSRLRRGAYQRCAEWVFHRKTNGLFNASRDDIAFNPIWRPCMGWSYWDALRVADTKIRVKFRRNEQNKIVGFCFEPW